VGFSGDGKTLAVALGTSAVELWDTERWEVRDIIRRERTKQFDCYSDVALSQDGQLFLGVPYSKNDHVLDRTRKIDIWEVSSQTRRELEFPMFYYLALSPDGKKLAVSIIQGGPLVVVNPWTGQEWDFMP